MQSRVEPQDEAPDLELPENLHTQNANTFSLQLRQTDEAFDELDPRPLPSKTAYRHLYKGKSKVQCWGTVVFGNWPSAILLSFGLMNIPVMAILIGLLFVLREGYIMLIIGAALLLICNIIMIWTATKDPGVLKWRTEPMYM